jgi:hypothetical protein
MKKILTSLCILLLFIFSACKKKIEEITQGKFEHMIQAGEVDHVEIGDERSVYVYMRDQEEPQYTFTITSNDSFMKAMVVLGQTDKVYPLVIE